MFPAMRLTATGIDDALARLDGLQRQIDLNIVVELERFGRIVTQEMIQTHTFQNITGRLERSIGYTVEQYGTSIMLNLFAMAPYAQAVEEGTPTSRPYPFFFPVLYKYLPDLLPALQRAVNEAYAQFGEGPRTR